MPSARPSFAGATCRIRSSVNTRYPKNDSLTLTILFLESQTVEDALIYFPGKKTFSSLVLNEQPLD